MFRFIFNTQFNLSFHPLTVDSCKICDSLDCAIQSQKATSDEKETLLLKKQVHQNLAKKIYSDQKTCIEQSHRENTVVLTFDLQRALEVPSIHTSVAFYKRKLWFYNLCIFDETKNEAYMYVWDESTASRGSQEIASCSMRHFETYIPIETKRIIAYSDSCGGQNRNIKISLMLKKFIADAKLPKLECIEQRYFKSGHCSRTN